ncbi:MAG TPA: hypothetical protein PK580_04575 [Nitrosomonas halophila]|nr:hypothetical protein [Nitrosomonas halophila]
MKTRTFSSVTILSIILLAITLAMPAAAQARNSQPIYGNQQNNYYFGSAAPGYPGYVTPRDHRRHKQFYKNRRHARHGYYNPYRYAPPYGGYYYAPRDNFSLGIRSGNARIMIGY